MISAFWKLIKALSSIFWKLINTQTKDCASSWCVQYTCEVETWEERGMARGEKNTGTCTYPTIKDAFQTNLCRWQKHEVWMLESTGWERELVSFDSFSGQNPKPCSFHLASDPFKSSKCIFQRNSRQERMVFSPGNGKQKGHFDLSSIWSNKKRVDSW